MTRSEKGMAEALAPSCTRKQPAQIETNLALKEKRKEVV